MSCYAVIAIPIKRELRPLVLRGAAIGYRATRCRCGGSHLTNGFTVD
jgi:hypothetical protein